MRASLLLLLLAAGPAAAQASLSADGSELFRGLMHRLGYEPVADGDSARVVVVFGPPRDTDVRAVCRRVLEAGGSVLIAADDVPGLGDHFPTRPPLGVRSGRAERFAAAELAAPARTRVGLVGPDRRPGPGPGLAVSDRVAVTWPPTSLTWTGAGDPWTGAAVAVSRDGVLAAVGGTGPPRRPGRALVVAGEGMFANLLLAGQFSGGSDTGNLDFAFATLRWLKPPGVGPVPCLFLDRGEVATRFADVYSDALLAQLPPPGPPPLSALLAPEAQAKLADAANEALDRVQAKDQLNAALARRFGRTVQWLLGGLAVLAAVGLFRRARAARRPTAPPPPAAAPPARPLAQRREELLRGGDHTAAVREYLVELFRLHGLPLDEYRHPRRMPRVEGDRPARERVATLWQAAYGPHPVGYTRWKELEPMIEEVRAAGAAGRWRFARGRA